MRSHEPRSCDKFDWYKRPRPIHPDWYKYPLGVCPSGDISMPSTCFEIADAKDVMSMQEEPDKEEAGVLRRLTKNEQKAACRVEAMQQGDWEKVAEIDRQGCAKTCAEVPRVSIELFSQATNC